jgi:hypothetical protein
MDKTSSLTPSPIDFPETLPNKYDILFVDNMKSQYMASYNDVLDVVHPGNKNWNQLITQYSFGFTHLSQSIEYQLRNSITKEYHNRILVQNSSSNWTVVSTYTDNQLSDWFCHKSF